jgi:hypothetical protein
MSSIYPSMYALEAVFLAPNRKALATMVLGHYSSLEAAKTDRAMAEKATPPVVEEIEGSLAAYRDIAVRAEYRITA